MNKFSLIGLFVLVLFPMMGFAQDSTAVALDGFVNQLDAQCPLEYKNDWGINSLSLVGDCYVLIDVKLPASLSMVLPSLTSGDDENAAKVKRMWMREFDRFGEDWNHLLELLVDANRRFIVNLHPEGYDDTELITFFPSDINLQ